MLGYLQKKIKEKHLVSYIDISIRFLEHQEYYKKINKQIKDEIFYHINDNVSYRINMKTKEERKYYYVNYKMEKHNYVNYLFCNYISFPIKTNKTPTIIIAERDNVSVTFFKGNYYF